MTVRDIIHDVCSALAMGGFVASVVWFADIMTATGHL